MLVSSDPVIPIFTLTDIVALAGGQWDAKTVPDVGDSGPGVLFRTQRQAGPCHLTRMKVTIHNSG